MNGKKVYWIFMAAAMLLLAALACGPQETGPTATPEVIVVTATGGAGGEPPTLEPTVPPDPTSTSVPGGCVDGMQFVADVTVPDGTTFAAGATFIKTWRLRNSGSCNWSGYRLVFDHGEPMGTPEQPIPDMPAGEEFDLSVEMTAPGGAGHYRGYWRIQSAGGANLGTVYCDIVVAGAEPVTEEPVTEEPVTEEPVTEEPVTEEPPPATAPPTNLTMSGWGLTSLTFSWNDATGEASYVLMIGTESFTLPADTTSYTWQNAPCGTSVSVTLIARAANSAEIGRVELFGVETMACQLPNLVIVEAYFEPAEVHANEAFRPHITVRNDSPVAVGPFSIRWTFHPVLEIPDCTARIDGLAPGAQASRSWERSTTAAPGGYRTDVTIDSQGEIDERNETDNATNLPIRVIQ